MLETMHLNLSSCDPAGGGAVVSNEGPGISVGDQRLQVLGEPAASAEQTEFTLDQLSAREHFATFRLVGTHDDSDHPTVLLAQCVAQPVARIASIRKKVTLPPIERTYRGEDVDGAIAILTLAA